MPFVLGPKVKIYVAPKVGDEYHGSMQKALEAVVVLVDEESEIPETAMLSEDALADWNRPEEDAAWSHLQLPKSS